MPFDKHEVDVAKQRQQDAAQDPSDQVRLVAGPGSGKSHAIEQRAAYLLQAGVAQTSLYAVSFTRASTADLRSRITNHCANRGIQAGDVRISTLHSLSLRLMKLANLLTQYPVEPHVLDDWEVAHWIDEEFAKFAAVTPARARVIRLEHEAFWSTGTRNPANYIAPDPPVTDAERGQFSIYHVMQSGFYACVLVGEIVRTCLTHVRNGLIDPVALLNIAHLIVDEYQDLNPMDIDFIDELDRHGVTIFVAGDDDQSVYAFRFASPEGIQSFVRRHPGAGDHELRHCFRCAPEILAAAQSLLAQFAAPARIPKHQVSLYASATPAVAGLAELWRFDDSPDEDAAIAASCRRLLDLNVAASEIMILLGNVNVQAWSLYAALDAAGVPYTPTKSDPFTDEPAGRCGLSILRIVQNPDDLVAHRVLLGLQHGVGPTRCLDITKKAIAANLTATDLYRGQVPAGLFTPALRAAVDGVRAVVHGVAGWDMADTLGQRRGDLGDLVEAVVGVGERAAWDTFLTPLPDDASLAEALDYLRASTDEEVNRVREDIAQRLLLPPPEDLVEERVAVRTMHGAKGLSAKVVFIPGLEEEISPGPRRAANHGLVLEGARLLYVSLTRARAAVFCSFSSGRYQHGSHQPHHASRYLAHLGLTATTRTGGLSNAEALTVAALTRAVDA